MVSWIFLCLSKFMVVHTWLVMEKRFARKRNVRLYFRLSIYYNNELQWRLIYHKPLTCSIHLISLVLCRYQIPNIIRVMKHRGENNNSNRWDRTYLAQIKMPYFCVYNIDSILLLNNIHNEWAGCYIRYNFRLSLDDENLNDFR